MPSSDYPNASAVRRLAAMVYDLFLIVAMWMLTTTLIVANVNDEAAIEYRMAFQGILMLELFLFYGYFWTMKGQTLGMQVWKLRAESDSGEILHWPQASLRFVVACLTPLIGFLWMIVDRDRLTLYDRFSNSRVVYTGNKPFAKEKPLASKEPSAKKKPSANKEPSPNKEPSASKKPSAKKKPKPKKR